MPIEVKEIALSEINQKSTRSEFGDMYRLAESMAEVGLLHPVVVRAPGPRRPKHELIAGARRIRAAEMLGWTAIAARVLNLDDLAAIRAQDQENVVRKDWAPSEQVAIAEAIERVQAREAKRRVKKGQAKPGEKVGSKASNNSSQPTESTKSSDFAETAVTTGCHQESGRSAAKAASDVGMSEFTYRHAKEVVEAAKEDPETFGPIQEEMDRTGKVDPAWKATREKKRNAEKPEKPLLDKNLVPVPADLREAFGKTKYDELVSALIKLERAAMEFAATPLGSQLACHLAEVGGAKHYEPIRRAILTFRGGKPHAVCAWCRSERDDSEGCNHCKGLGWLCKYDADRVPGDYQEKLQERLAVKA